MHERQRRQAHELARRGDPVRQAAQRLYQSAAWKRLRAQTLSEEPQCRAPGCGRPSTQADHIVPLRDGGAPLERGNVQALCLQHHSAKGARLGERYRRRR
jgi:5-methylcytosine-specific restriction endonuclease McrA